MQSGEGNFTIFLDRHDIAWGQQWAQRLDDTLGAVTLLIPMITPSFFKSEACRGELVRFVEREKQLGRGDLILPVYYVKTPLLDNPHKRRTDELAELIHSRNHIDWRHLRHHPLSSQPSKELLAYMAEQIVAAMEREAVVGVVAPVPRGEIIRRVPVKPVPPVIAPLSPASPKPEWASASGVDGYGKWAEITVREIVQRLRWIEPGSFLMGAPKSETEGLEHPKWYLTERPLHRVSISQGLWLADTACTQKLWKAVMHRNPSYFNGRNRGGLQHPVEYVSWSEVQLFLQKITKGLPGCMATLPTEAEWEYACRAGSKTAFSFDELVSTDQVNFNGYCFDYKGEKGEDRERTLPVKALPANPWGLYEMHGNVREWCADRMRDYAAIEYVAEEVKDPGLADAFQAQVDNNQVYALRGGSWQHDAWCARSAYRDEGGASHSEKNIGFRLVCRPSMQ